MMLVLSKKTGIYVGIRKLGTLKNPNFDAIKIMPK